MKLKAPRVLSQRDPSWGSIILGYNAASARDASGHPFSIYWYGCLITCLAMYVGKTPAEVNQILKDGSGFQSGTGLFLWAKSVLVGLTQSYVSPTYNGPVTDQGIAKIKELLDSKLPVLARVDFNPATEGEEMHFVLIVGYEGDVLYALDPWTGQLISLDVYGGPKRAIIQFRAYDKALAADEAVDIQAEMDKLRQDRDRNWNWFSAVCDALGVAANVDAAVAEAKKLVGLDDVLRQKDRQIEEATQIARDLDVKLKQSGEDLAKAVEASTGLAEDLKESNGNYEKLQTTHETMKEELVELKKIVAEPVLSGWRRTIHDWVIRL